MNTTIQELRAKIEAVSSFRHVKEEVEAPVEREFQFPAMALLKDYGSPSASENKMDSGALESKLMEFGFKGKVVNIRRGPVISRYEVKLAPGVRLSQVKSISEDLAIALMSDRIRIQAPIPGTALVGIEVANEKASMIGFRNVIRMLSKNNASFVKLVRTKEIYQLPMIIGTDTAGDPKVIDLTTMPHLLVAGQTGSGKSVCLNSIIMSVLYTKTPEECKLVLVDPKRVEMSIYKDMPHLLCPVVTEPEKATEVFGSLINIMEQRYETLSQHKVRNIKSYNKIEGIDKMSYIVAVVDEMADLMMTAGKALEAQIVRLAQLSRAVGIHLVLATQKPIVKVITGLIKSNMPSRISFQVSSNTDSRVILDCGGAEKLAGQGDMLMLHPGSSEPERFHGAWISDGEITAVTDFIKGE